MSRKSELLFQGITPTEMVSPNKIDRTVDTDWWGKVASDALQAGTGGFFQTAMHGLQDITGDPNFGKEIENYGADLEREHQQFYEPGSARYYASAAMQSLPEMGADMVTSMGVAAAANAALGPQAAAAAAFARGLTKAGEWSKRAYDFYNGGSRLAQAARYLTPAVEAKNVPGWLAATATGTGLESAFEGQRAMDDYIAEQKAEGNYIPGVTEQAGRELRYRVARDNAALLTGSNAIEDALIFGKGKGFFGGLGRLGRAMAVEGAEEGAQQIIPKAEQGKDWSLTDRDVLDSVLVGALMGGGMHLGGRGIKAAFPGAFGDDTPSADMGTQGADIDEQVKNLNGGWDDVIPQIGGVLKNKFGLEGVISSGARTAEHNAEVGGAENSYHIQRADGGDALDIVLPDNTTQEQADAIEKYFKDTGMFEEVLFHDVGSGYHLHLGGLKGGNLGGAPSSGQREGDANAWAIHDVFKEAGYSDEAIAGILGRVQQEHNFDTGDVEEHWDTDANGNRVWVGGYGMFQWNGGRTTNFKKWAEENGLDPKNPTVQAQYALKEAYDKGLTPEVMNKLNHEEAADLWTNEWEVGNPGDERKYAGEWLERIKKGGSSKGSSNGGTISAQNFGKLVGNNVIDFAGSDSDLVTQMYQRTLDSLNADKKSSLPGLFDENGAFVNTSENRQAVAKDEELANLIRQRAEEEASQMAAPMADKQGRISKQAVQDFFTPKVAGVNLNDLGNSIKQGKLSKQEKAAMLQLADDHINIPRNNLSDVEQAKFVNDLQQAIDTQDYGRIYSILPNETAQALSALRAVPEAAQPQQVEQTAPQPIQQEMPAPQPVQQTPPAPMETQPAQPQMAEQPTVSKTEQAQPVEQYAPEQNIPAAPQTAPVAQPAFNYDTRLAQLRNMPLGQLEQLGQQTLATMQAAGMPVDADLANHLQAGKETAIAFAEREMTRAGVTADSVGTTQPNSEENPIDGIDEFVNGVYEDFSNGKMSIKEATRVLKEAKKRVEKAKWMNARERKEELEYIQSLLDSIHMARLSVNKQGYLPTKKKNVLKELHSDIEKVIAQYRQDKISLDKAIQKVGELANSVAMQDTSLMEQCYNELDRAMNELEAVHNEKESNVASQATNDEPTGQSRPDYSKMTLEELKAERNKIIDQTVQMMKDNPGGKGVLTIYTHNDRGEINGRYGESLNPQWYQDARKKLGRTPRPSDYESLAIDELMNHQEFAELEDEIARREKEQGTTEEASAVGAKNAQTEESTAVPEKDYDFGDLNENATDLANALGISSVEQEKAKPKAKSNTKSKTKKKRNLGFDDSDEALEAAKKELQEALKKSRNRLNAMPVFDLDVIVPALKVGAIYVQRGASSFTEYARDMINAVGNEIRDWLRPVWKMLESYPEGKAFDESQVIPMFRYVGSYMRNNKQATFDEVKSDFAKRFGEDNANKFNDLLRVGYEGAYECFNGKGEVTDDELLDGAGRPAEQDSTGDNQDQVGTDNGNAESDEGRGPGVQQAGKGSRSQRGGGVHGRSTASGRETGNSGVQGRTPGRGAGDVSPGGEHLTGSRRDSFDGPPVDDGRDAESFGPFKDGPDNGGTAGNKAEAVKVNKDTFKAGDKKQIAGSMPFLMPEQVNDVVKADKRFYDDKGEGMMYTNGTGTGKTFTGLGCVKRAVQQGKKNILIIAPNETVQNDWIAAGKGFFGLDISKLENTKDAGKGIVIGLYENVGANNALLKRDWDMIVADEAHKLMSGKEGDETLALDNLRAMTYHHKGLTERFNRLHADEFDRLAEFNGKAKEDKLTAEENKERNDLNAKLVSEGQKAIAEWQTIKQEDKPKVLFLSATPFSYVKDIKYAEGYLFNYDNAKDSTAGGNRPNGYQDFMIKHFGYRMRYGKLTEPDADVNSDLMEIQFNNWLKQQGVLSSRKLDVKPDYERGYILVDGGIGKQIDEGMKVATERGVPDASQKYSLLHSAFQNKLKGNKTRYLLEAIKAKAAVPLINEYLKGGKKVVVFHDFKKNEAENPFVLTDEDFKGLDEIDKARAMRQYEEFCRDHPELINLDLKDLQSPIERFTETFGNKLKVYNGSIAKPIRDKGVKEFNDDDSKVKVILCQRASAKEGISMHDTTGKHQRVLIDIGIPTRPTDLIQCEGRIYRVGVVSDAIIRYLNTGMDMEKRAFASVVAGRSGTAENLSMGEEARALRPAIVDAYMESLDGDSWKKYLPNSPTEGKGGKERDAKIMDGVSPYDAAKSDYFANQKKTSKNKAQEGVDYYATPEPVGFKMVEWLGLKPGDRALEPSAGHGAISRYFGAETRNTIVEPSGELATLAKMRLNGGTTSKVFEGRFEDLDIHNKYEGIAMNPPYGVGGKTAYEHLEKAFDHLADGGRVIAIVPDGPAANKRLEKWLYGDGTKENPGESEAVVMGEIKLPQVTFNRAGTNVATKILVIDKYTDEGDRARAAAEVKGTIDLTGVKDINELFDKLENRTFPERVGANVPKHFVHSTDKKPGNNYQYTSLPDDVKLMADGGLKKLVQRFNGRADNRNGWFGFRNENDRAKFERAANRYLYGEEAVKAEQQAITDEVMTPAVTEHFEAGEHEDTRNGEKSPKAAIRNNLSREVYDKVKAIANDNGGYWSRYAKGFLFKDVAGRDNFLKEAEALLTKNGSFSVASSKSPAPTTDDLEKLWYDTVEAVSRDELTEKEKELIQVAESLGADLRFVTCDKRIQGKYDPFTGISYINRDAEGVTSSWIAWHEMFHWIKANNPELYDALVEHLKSQAPFSKEQLNEYRRAIGRPDISDEKVIEEMMADAFPDVHKRVPFFRNLAKEEPSLYKRLVAFVKRVIDDIVSRFYAGYKRGNGLTIRQVSLMQNAFADMVEALKDGDGKPIFKVGKDGFRDITDMQGRNLGEIEAAFSVSEKKSGDSKNMLDDSDNLGDNVDEGSVEQFYNKFDAGTQSMFADKSYTQEDIVQTYNDVMAAMDGAVLDKIDKAQSHAELDEIRDNLKPIRARLMDFNNATTPEGKEQAAIDLRAAREVFENADRGNEARSRIEAEAPPSYQRSRNNRTEQAVRQGLHGGRGEGISEFDYSVNGYLLETPNNKREGNDYYVNMRKDYKPKKNSVKRSSFSVAPVEDAPGSIKSWIKSTAEMIGMKAGVVNQLEKNVRDEYSNKLNSNQTLDSQLPKLFFMASPSYLAKKSEVFKVFFDASMKAVHRMLGLRAEFDKAMAQIKKLTRDKEDRKNLTDLCMMGDAEGLEYTEDELKKEGFSDNVISAYKLIRANLAKAYSLINDARMQVTVHNRTIKANDLNEFMKENFIDDKDILSKKELDNGKILLTYRGCKVYENSDDVSEAVLKEMEKNDNIYIKSKKKLGEGIYHVEFNERPTPLGHLTGYIPHFFHRFMVYQVMKDEHGNEHRVSVGSAKSLKGAVDIANAFARGNSESEFVIDTHSFDKLMGDDLVVIGDKGYQKMAKNLADSTEMNLKEARKFLHDSAGAKLKNRHRFFGNAMHRTGAEGYDTNLMEILPKYFNSASRYVALEEWKPYVISMYERFFGDFNADPSTIVGEGKQQTARYIRKYIMDMNGIPRDVEKWGNDIISRTPLLGKMLSDHFEGRPALALSSGLSWFNAVTSLGILNPASAMLNFMQYINIGTMLNSYKYANMGLSKALNPSELDKKILDKSGVLSQMNNAADAGGYYQNLTFDLNLDKEKGGLRAGAGLLKNLLNAGMMPFTMADALMRKAAVLGAYYQGVQEKGMKPEQGEEISAKALKYAQDVNDESNFIYDSSDTPEMIRMGSVLTQQFFQFQKYPIKQFEFFLNHVINAKNNAQRARFLLPYVLLTGLPGMIPFGNLLAQFINIVAASLGAGDDDDKFTDQIKAGLMRWAGNDGWKQGIVESVYNGPLAGVLGIDISERAGMQNFAEGRYYGAHKPESAIGAAAMALSGPTYSKVANFMDQLKYGNKDEAVKAISPSLGNLFQAIEGASHTSHGRIASTYDTAWQRILHGAGFRHIDETNAAFINNYIYSSKKAEREDKKFIMDEYLNDPSTENLYELRSRGITDKELEAYKKNKEKSNKERAEGEEPKKPSKKPKSEAQVKADELREFMK